MSHRPSPSRWSPHPPPPIPASSQHTRSPSTSSASSTSSHHSHSNARAVNSGFTVFPNSSSTTIKLIPPLDSSFPTTPTQQSRAHSNSTTSQTSTSSSHYASSIQSTASTPGSRTPSGPGGPGYFEPAMMHTSSSHQPSNSIDSLSSNTSRKRSSTEPSTASPPLTSSTLLSSTSFSALPHPPTPSIPIPQPSTSASVPPSSLSKKEKDSSSKSKFFSKPARIPTPGFGSLEKALRPPPSPSKHIASSIASSSATLMGASTPRASMDSRKPSFSTDHVPGYSESPPHEHSSTKEKKSHFLRPGRSKDKDKSGSGGGNLYPTPSLATLPPLVTASSTMSLGHSGEHHPKSSLDLISSPLSGNPSSSAADLESDPWPALRETLLPLFHGMPLDPGVAIETLNLYVRVWMQRHVPYHPPTHLLSDLAELLESGMRSIAPRGRETSDEDLVPRIVEAWEGVFSFTTPYLEAVFLPLQREFKGAGGILTTPQKARDYWGGETIHEVRRIVMLAFRDFVLLPNAGRLRIVFSRFGMDFERSGGAREVMGVVARMLQCVSVLGGCLTERDGKGDEGQREVEELAMGLKMNWMGRGRAGRNRRGFVGGKGVRVG